MHNISEKRRNSAAVKKKLYIYKKKHDKNEKTAEVQEVLAYTKKQHYNTEWRNKEKKMGKNVL